MSPIQSLYVEACEPPLSDQEKTTVFLLLHQIEVSSKESCMAMCFQSHILFTVAARPLCVPAFGLRMTDLLSELDLDTSTISHSEHVAVAPWDASPISVDFSLHRYPKACSPDYMYQQLFADFR